MPPVCIMWYYLQRVIIVVTLGCNCHIARPSCRFKCQDKAVQAPVVCLTVVDKQRRSEKFVKKRKEKLK